MPSPFPGMDPFIESQEWDDFHPRLNARLADLISAAVEPRYVVRVERRVYVEGLDDDVRHYRTPDVAIVTADRRREWRGAAELGGVAVTPVECRIPEPEEYWETYLVIRRPGGGEVVTVIETLSPANKQPNSRGRREYLDTSPTHLVELDLLRGGVRPPISGRPPGDYFAMVSRAQRRPKIDVYAWTLRQPVPPIRIPLAPEDDEPLLDLQAAVSSVYDSARYQLSLDYAAPLQPELSESDAAWLRERIG